MLKEKRQKELQDKLVTLAILTILYCVIRSVPIKTYTNLTGDLLSQNLSTFTGMQLNKITFFSLGITPYMLTKTVIELLRTNLLPDVKRFIENPKNTAAVKKIEKGIFLLYCILQTIILYSEQSFLIKTILVIGAIVLMVVANSITKMQLISGTSYVLAISILSEIISNVSNNLLPGIITIFVMIMIALIYYKLGESYTLVHVKDERVSFKSEAKIPLSYTGVTPLFYASLFSALIPAFLDSLNLENETVLFYLLYISSIYIFSIYSFYKSFNLKGYVNNLVLEGYYIEETGRYPKKISRFLNWKVLKTAIVSATFMNLFVFIPVLAKNCLNIVIPISMISVILLIGILRDFVEAVKNYNIKTNYQPLV